MPDFTAALYLGLRHESAALRPWSQLTNGRPAAAGVYWRNQHVAGALACLQGCQRAVLGPSTLHLFWDLFGVLARCRIAIYVDAGTYPVARWGVERARARGVPVRAFAHYDPLALDRLLRRDVDDGRVPVVVADGVCPSSGDVAPIRDYLETLQARRGWLLLDDTQALGLLGHAPTPTGPYGLHGGGSMRFSGIAAPNVVIVSSMAKAFGVPLGVLAGSRQLLEHFVAHSDVSIHTSPPCVAVVHAAERALALNVTHGETVRRRLARNVTCLRAALCARGIGTRGKWFPVQTLILKPGCDPMRLHRDLLRCGVRTVLHAARVGGRACISLIVTANHCASELMKAAAAVARALLNQGVPSVGMESNYEPPNADARPV